MPATNAPRIAALGYYGFGNLGDEAVLAGIRHSLAAEVGACDMLVLSADAVETTRIHPGVATVDRWNWRAVAHALRGTDVFVLGGGSLLQDATSVKSVVWYALMALLARRRCRRVLWWGQGIGPLRSAIGRRIVRLIANQADAICVRDEESAVLLKAIGARGSIHQVADPAFSLQPFPIPRSVGRETSWRGCPVLVALRSWKADALGLALRDQNMAGIFGTNDGLEETNDVCALPMHLPEDAEYFASLRIGDVSVYDWRHERSAPEQVLGFVQSARLVVAMRLHALIFAARCGVPFVAISYDPKVDALASGAGQKDALLAISDLSASRLADTVALVRKTAPLRRRQLIEFAALQAEKALRPAIICRDIL